MSGILDGNSGDSAEQTANVSVGVVVCYWSKGEIGKEEHTVGDWRMPWVRGQTIPNK